MQKKARLLIVEDEESLLKGLVKEFTYQGYKVDFSWDGDEGLRKALSGDYDLILLDVMLPKTSGYHICKAVKEEHPHQAIIFLSAKCLGEDHIHGYELGADHYISKPFSLEELTLRVQALLRRVIPSTETEQYLHLSNGVVIDLYNLQGESFNGETVSFAKKEVEILQYLAEQSPRPVSQDELLRVVWGYTSQTLQTRTVDSHIAKIRKKIEHTPSKPSVLLTCRGFGYKLNIHSEGHELAAIS